MGEWRYERLTWPELEAKSRSDTVCLVPVGAIEQHGPHLPLDVDARVVTAVAQAAGERLAGRLLVLPCVSYGYAPHVMDFTGTISIASATFMEFVLDICRSLASHGFQRVMLLNGHGSNRPNLDLVARQANLEVESEIAFASWWNMLTVDPQFMSGWRESRFPGGCSHACELETSVYMHLAPEGVRMDAIVDGDTAFNAWQSPFRYSDLFTTSPVQITTWTSSYSTSGVLGQATLATPEKGAAAFEEAVRQLCGFVDEWLAAPLLERVTRHER